MTESPHHHVCPLWVGHLLASPLRAIFQNPAKILGPHVKSGMRVMDIGPALGFFSLPMARMVGPEGRVICVDVQQRMLDALVRRAQRARLADRIETRTADADGPGAADLAETIDFVLAFAVVHEAGDAPQFFAEVHRVLRPGGRVLFAEPSGHVSEGAFGRSSEAAVQAGLRRVVPVKIARSHAALLEKA